MKRMTALLICLAMMTSLCGCIQIYQSDKNSAAEVVESSTEKVEEETSIESISGNIALETDEKKTAEEKVAYDATEIFELFQDRAVKIDVGHGGGSGFYLEEDIIATNYHVIRDAASLTIENTKGERFPVIEIVGYSEKHDLAFLRVEETMEPLVVSDTGVVYGEQIFSIGGPMGIFPYYSTGIVGKTDYKEGETKYILSNMPSIGGMSGSAVLNQYGEVVGVVVGGVSDGSSGIAMIIDHQYLLTTAKNLSIPVDEFLNRNNLSYEHAEIEEAEIGNSVAFGSYEQDNDLGNGSEAIEWIVIGKEENKLQLVSLQCLDAMAFQQNGGPVNWASSDVRQFLNSEFYRNAFSDEERARILQTKVETNDNPIHGTSGGDATMDYVYLLSLEEVCEMYGIHEYFENFFDGVYAEATPYAISKGIWLEVEGSSRCWWWLRSSGGNPENAAEVGSLGYISFNGSLAITSERGLRPVIWITIE